MLTDGRTDGLTDGRTDGQKIGRLYRTLLQAGAIKRVIALILVNIVPRWDIEGRSQAHVLRYPSSGQYSPISVQWPFNIGTITICYMCAVTIFLEKEKLSTLYYFKYKSAFPQCQIWNFPTEIAMLSPIDQYRGITARILQFGHLIKIF